MHNHIMETTAALFVTVPFSKLTVKQICEAANINRNTFYRHFDDKFALLEFMLTEAITRLFSEVDLADFREHPFQIIADIKFSKSISTLDFQFDDSLFQDIFDSLIFKILRQQTSDQEFLWSLGNMYIIRLWNHNLEKPYTLHDGYPIFDQMFNEGKFPDDQGK